MLGGPLHAGQATNHGGRRPAVQLPLLLLPLQAQAPLEDPRDGGCNCPRVGQAAGVAEGVGPLLCTCRLLGQPALVAIPLLVEHLTVMRG